MANLTIKVSSKNFKGSFSDLYAFLNKMYNILPDGNEKNCAVAMFSRLQTFDVNNDDYRYGEATMSSFEDGIHFEVELSMSEAKKWFHEWESIADVYLFGTSGAWCYMQQNVLNPSKFRVSSGQDSWEYFDSVERACDFANNYQKGYNQGSRGSDYFSCFKKQLSLA
jgi:hypothetical protein